MCLTSKIKHFKRDSLPLSIPRQFTPVGTTFGRGAEQVLLGGITWLIHVPGSSTAVLNNLVVVILVLCILNLVPVHRCF